MFNAIYVDDEPIAHLQFKKIIAKEPRINLLDTFSSGKDAIDYALECVAQKTPRKIDIIFSDIQMPHLNGLELAERIQTVMPFADVVFVTAFDSYTLEAYKLLATGYLLKPIALDDVKKLVDKLETRHPSATTTEQEQTAPAKKNEKLTVTCFGNTKLSFKLPTEKAAELFYLYISKNGEEINREKIYTELWPDFDAQKAYNNFYVTNTFLKKTLAANGYDTIIERKDDYYSIPTDRLNCDYFNFMKATDTTFAISIKKLEEITATYTGDFCADKEWLFVEPVRTACKKKYITLLYKLADLYLDATKSDKAEKTLQTILDTDLYEEKAFNQLKKLYLDANKIKKCKELEDSYKKKLDDAY